VKKLGVLIGCAALYGFSVGCVHSLEFGLHNLIKFPLLLLVTASVCAVAYHLVASFAGARLRFAEVQELSFALFRDASVILASLSPVGLFLAVSIERPDATGLHEYPLFLGFNVLLIAVSGVTALWRQTRGLMTNASLDRKRGTIVVTSWLLLSLLVGSQAAWFFRPFFGVATISSEVTPFFLGTHPDFRGATNFYEAVWQIFSPPDRSLVKKREVVSASTPGAVLKSHGRREEHRDHRQHAGAGARDGERVPGGGLPGHRQRPHPGGGG
jgi:hypothetical protein